MHETIVVTTCSVNHLAQAKGLGDSLLKYNPGYQLVIGLTDRAAGRIPADYIAPHHLVEAHSLGLEQFDDLCRRYSIFELNCALKIFFAAWAMEHYQAARVIFLDSDVLVFHSLQVVEAAMTDKAVLLTPHILTPFPNDGKRPFEREMLKNGVFNGGFFAISNNPQGHTFIHWWKQRMLDQCNANPKEGLFVDQKWLNLAPVFFPFVECLQHPGCNVAYWNLHERNLTVENGIYYSNGQPLIFFHYSGYSPEFPEQLSRHQDRISMNDHPVYRELFSLYHSTLEKNEHNRFRRLSCYYGAKRGFLHKLGLK